jgi:hypothetical protein
MWHTPALTKRRPFREPEIGSETDNRGLQTGFSHVRLATAVKRVWTVLSLRLQSNVTEWYKWLRFS